MSAQHAKHYGVISSLVVLLCLSTLLPSQDTYPSVTIHIDNKKTVEGCLTCPSIDCKLSVYGSDDVDLWPLILLIKQCHKCLIKPKWIKSYQDRGKKSIHDLQTNTKMNIMAHESASYIYILTLPLLYPLPFIKRMDW